MPDEVSALSVAFMGSATCHRGIHAFCETVFVNFYKRFLDLLCWISELICGVALVFLTVIFGWLVYGRYVLNATPTWVEQASLLLIVLIGFLGASVGVRHKTHLGVTFIRDYFPRPVRRLFELLCYLIMGGFGVVMAVNSYSLAVFKWGSMIPLIGLPEGLRAIPIALCGGLILLYSIEHVIDWYRGDDEQAPAARQL